MAQFTKVNGDYLPVMNFDKGSYTNSGLNAVESAATVQPQGPKLQFFTVTAAGALTGAQVNTVVQATQQLATVYIYEYTDDTNDSLAMAIYPVDAWTAGTLETAVEAALTAAGTANNVTVTATATFTN
jgi:hypothetical protein